MTLMLLSLYHLSEPHRLSTQDTSVRACIKEDVTGASETLHSLQGIKIVTM